MPDMKHKLTLEVNTAMVDERMGVHDGEKDPNVIKVKGETVYASPHGGANNWLFRVKVSDAQAVIGFRKHFTIGIGFMAETDKNTNSPYECATDYIYDHIRVNKGDDLIPDERCIKAIRLIRTAAKNWMDFETKAMDKKVMKVFPELQRPDGNIMTLMQFRKACRVAQGAYGGEYHVVFGWNVATQAWKYKFDVNSKKGKAAAMQFLYWYLRNTAIYNDPNLSRHDMVKGADFAYNKASLPNKWDKDLLGASNFVV